MKKVLRFFSLLMATAMMAMSPMKMWADDVASVTINGNTTNYTTVEAAFTAANVADQTSTIKLLADYTTQNSIQATAGNITLDLNGKTLAHTIQVAGANLTIKDGGIGGTVSGSSNALEFSSGKLTINGGIFKGSSISLYAYGAQNYSAGDIVIRHGKFIKGSAYSIFVPYSGEAKWDLINFKKKVVDENGNEVSTSTNNPTLSVTVEVGKIDDSSYVEIGDPDAYNNAHPYYTGYKNSTTITLYKGSEIGRSGMITDIAYNVAAKATIGLTPSELKVYMMMTDKTNLNDYSDLAASAFTLVYSGNPTLGATEGWENLKLDYPFNYNDNTKNLLIAVCRKHDVDSYPSYYYTNGNSGEIRAIGVGRDSNSQFGELSYLENWSSVDSWLRSSDEEFANTQIRLIDVCSTRTIEDGTAYSTPAYVNELTYKRTFSNTNWQALYVPFQMSYSDWKDEFEVGLINDVNQYDTNDDGAYDVTEIELLKLKGGTIKPNTPYFIRAKKAGDKVITLSNVSLSSSDDESIECSSTQMKYTFTGTYSGVSGSEMYSKGYYALAGGNLSKPESSSVSLKPMRWYMNIESKGSLLVNTNTASNVRVRVIGEDLDDATAIADVEVKANEKATTYTLDGRPANGDNLKPGMYIKNGKKIMIR